MEDTSN